MRNDMYIIDEYFTWINMFVIEHLQFNMFAIELSMDW